MLTKSKANLLTVGLLGFMTVQVSAENSDFNFSAKPISKNVYSIISPSYGRPSAENKGWNSNSHFVVTSEGVLVFDTGSSQLIGKGIIKAIKSVTEQPIRWVVNSHSHADHWLGNAAFVDIGAEVISIGTEPDGYNINYECGSTHPEKVQEEVIKQRADFGIALDGDGDRVVLIDRKGRLLDGDDIMYILAYANPNRTGPWSGIIGTAMSNFGLEEALKKLGYKFKRADVGDKHVNEMLKKEGWMLGGEPSGHIICRDLVSTGDGTIAALKVISSLLILEKDPEDVLQNYKKMPQININVDVANKDILSDAEIQQKIKEIESDLTIGRILVRASGTESKIRIMIESDDEATAIKYAKDIEKILKR